MCYFSVLIPRYHIHGLSVLNSPSFFLNYIAPIDNLFLFIEGPVIDGQGHLCVISPCWYLNTPYKGHALLSLSFSINWFTPIDNLLLFIEGPVADGDGSSMLYFSVLAQYPIQGPSVTVYIFKASSSLSGNWFHDFSKGFYGF